MRIWKGEKNLMFRIFKWLIEHSTMYEVYMSLRYGPLIGTDFTSCLWFDHETKEILVDEQSLMRIIMMVNSYQKPRKIRLVTREEMKEYKSGKKR